MMLALKSLSHVPGIHQCNNAAVRHGDNKYS